MIIGIPREVKTRETRVGIVPGGVRELVKRGHKVFIEQGAGLGAGISDAIYQESGAQLVKDRQILWRDAEMIIKVKEPIAEEYNLLQSGQILYTYLHLAAAAELTDVLVQKKITGIAYETIQLADRSLPLLKPMSEVAGRMSVQVGAQNLQRHNGGKGFLLGGVPGVRRGQVCILGGGVAGINAAKIAIGMGALVTVLDVDQQRLAYLDDVFGSTVTTMMSNPENISRSVISADLVISTVLIAGAKAPILVTREMIAQMEAGSVIVDISIDQGGSVEGIRPTTHDNPTFIYEGVLMYGVTNIPGDVSITSTYALTNATLPYALQLADQGFNRAVSSIPALFAGVNTYQGSVTHKAVAQALNLPFRPLEL